MAAPRKAAIRDDLKNTQGSQPHRMSEVMLRIIAFPVEQKTPIIERHSFTDYGMFDYGLRHFYD